MLVHDLERSDQRLITAHADHLALRPACRIMIQTTPGPHVLISAEKNTLVPTRQLPTKRLDCLVL